MRDFHLPGRSTVHGRRAMCATSHPSASLAAIETLKAGGNAVDAAIAAVAVLAVVEPAMTGIGGDCFALVAKPDGTVLGLSGAGRAPAAAEAAWYAQKGITEIEVTTPHAVTVPGAVAGWVRLLDECGTMGLDRLLTPAIDHAEGGLVVAPRIAHDWAVISDKIAKHPGARQHLHKAGAIPRVGEVMRFPALAGTLRRIAEGGRDAFYTGAVAEDIVAELQELGGLHTVEDFAAQDATLVTPISAPYGGLDVLQLPPSNHGIVALVMLGILARLGKPQGGPVSAERFHVLIETARLAYAMRDKFVADPDIADVPVAHMLSAGFLDDMAARINPTQRTPDLGPIPDPSGSDTVYLTVVDEAGMAVSFINSLFSAFGSGIVTRKTGVTLHNRGTGFVLTPGHRNCIAPRKRPMHTLIPGMAMRDGRPVLSFGVMGAAYQPFGHVYVISNMIDYGMDAQEALDCARVFFEGDTVSLETGVPEAVASALQGMGHKVSRRPDPWGGGQIVALDHDNGVLVGASDPRKDGLALGY